MSTSLVFKLKLGYIISVAENQRTIIRMLQALFLMSLLEPLLVSGR